MRFEQLIKEIIVAYDFIFNNKVNCDTTFGEGELAFKCITYYQVRR